MRCCKEEGRLHTCHLHACHCVTVPASSAGLAACCSPRGKRSWQQQQQQSMRVPVQKPCGHRMAAARPRKRAPHPCTFTLQVPSGGEVRPRTATAGARHHHGARGTREPRRPVPVAQQGLGRHPVDPSYKGYLSCTSMCNNNTNTGSVVGRSLRACCQEARLGHGAAQRADGRRRGRRGVAGGVDRGAHRRLPGRRGLEVVGCMLLEHDAAL